MAYAPATDLGTLKGLTTSNSIVNGVNPGGAAWTTVSCATAVPSGTKAIQIELDIRSSAVGDYVIVAQTSARAGPEVVQFTQAANTENTAFGPVSLDSSLQFAWYASGANLDYVLVKIVGYYL